MAFAKDRDETSSRSSDEELQDQISQAQRLAGTKLMESAAVSVAPTEELGAITAKDIYGNWTDSFGNTVCVYSMDAFTTRLVATLSKPPRRDINLPLRPLQDGWLCGRGVLDHSRSCAEDGTLCWVFPDGSFSTWSRMQSISATAVSAVPMPMLPVAQMPAQHPEGYVCVAVAVGGV
mmetsp:Transcript_21785/g.49588  ORF Transcript_21785/g.49588 Transcript_21785/m.49588 type:complete len:177 (+) Transcript_21785:54-584(+)